MSAKEDDHSSYLLEIWKKLVDLHIFHDGLDQERKRRYMTISIAISAGTIYSFSNFFEKKNSHYAIIAIIGMAANIINSVYMYKMHSRARDYVSTIKNQLRNVEKIYINKIKSEITMPYNGQFYVLNKRNKKIDQENAEYINLVEGINFNQAASLSEAAIIKIIIIFWSLFLVVFCCVFLASLR